jgi:hypothetical protein
MLVAAVAGLFVLGLVLGWAFDALLEKPQHRRWVVQMGYAVLLAVTIGGCAYSVLFRGQPGEAALWAAGAIFAALELWGLRNAQWQERALGSAAWRECVTVTKSLSRYSGRLRILGALQWVAIAGGLAIILSQLRGEPSLLLLALGLYFVITGLGQRQQQRVPAALLVLGASSNEQISLQVAIRQKLFPFRPVSLLQTGVAKIDMRIPGDCFRIDREIEWQTAVFAFCRSLPLIVLDARNITPFVEHEIEHVLAGPYVHKTLFIGGTDIRPAVKGLLHVPDPAAAIAFLRYLFLEKRALPTSATPIARLFAEWENASRVGASRAGTRAKGPGTAS